MSFVRKLRDLSALARDALGMGGELMLKPGDAAPDFTVSDHLGKTRKLADFRGKKLLLWFYPKADTPG